MSREERLQAGVERLALTLMAHTGADVDEQQENYLADAREIAETHPHLLTAWERGIDLDDEEDEEPCPDCGEPMQLDTCDSCEYDDSAHEWYGRSED